MRTIPGLLWFIILCQTGTAIEWCEDQLMIINNPIQSILTISNRMSQTPMPYYNKQVLQKNRTDRRKERVP